MPVTAGYLFYELMFHLSFLLIGRNFILKEKIVTDPKRKRVENELLGGNIGDISGLYNVQTDGLFNNIGPKNLDMAGAGLLARQAQ